MALIKLGLATTCIRGKAGNVVFSSSAGGPMMRSIGTVANPRTLAQQAVRLAVATAAATWRHTLTSAERTAWETYAAATRGRGKYGQETRLSGWNCFAAQATLLARAGLAPVIAAPAAGGVPVAPGIPLIQSVPMSHIITLSPADTWRSVAGAHCFVFQTKSQSPTRSTRAGSYLYAGVASGNAGSPAASITAASRDEEIFSAGQIIYFRMILVDPQGRVSLDTVIRHTINVD